MKFIKLKGVQGGKTRKNGTQTITPIFIEKSHKYAKTTKETAIRRNKNIIVTGEHDSGKSKTLLKLSEHALHIWGGYTRVYGVVYLDHLQPIAQWYEQEHISRWFYLKYSKDWGKLKGYEKAQYLPLFCKSKSVALFIDNADKLTGRKLNIAKQCITAAKICVVSVQSENRLSPSIRSILLSSHPQFIRLSSEAAYDATNMFLWGLIAACMAAGMWEVAFILGGLKVLGSGRGASRGV